MGLDGKHSFGSIGDTRVTFVEKKIDENRKDFLKKLLEHNGFEVIVEEEKRKSEEGIFSYHYFFFTFCCMSFTFFWVACICSRRSCHLDFSLGFFLLD